MFKSTSSAVWLGREREKAILELCRQHMEKIVETVNHMGENIHAFCDMDTKKAEGAFKMVFKMEREADEIKRGILDELSKGIFHPINRDEIIRLVLTADDIATNAKATTRRLKLIPPRKLDERLRGRLREFSDILLEIARLLGKSFEALPKEPGKARELADEVERLEEKIDDLRMESMMPEVVAWGDRSGKPGLSLMLKDVIDHMENVADRCEDVADVIRGIAISHA